MLAIVVTLNVFVIAAIIFVSFIIGFIVRNSQSSSLKDKITELEKEVLASHAEILQVQREKIELMHSINEPAIPVISISATKDEKVSDKNPDVSARKKLLSNQPPVKQKSGS